MRVARSRELVAQGRPAAVVAPVAGISRQAIYRRPKRPPTGQRRPLDDVDHRRTSRYRCCFRVGASVSSDKRETPAVVVGSGPRLGREFIAPRGFAVTGFAVSRTAIVTRRRRHSDSVVDYHLANLLDLPAEWDAAFDVVLESLTVQSLAAHPCRGQGFAGERLETVGIEEIRDPGVPARWGAEFRRVGPESWL